MNFLADAATLGLGFPAKEVCLLWIALCYLELGVLCFMDPGFLLLTRKPSSRKIDTATTEEGLSEEDERTNFCRSCETTKPPRTHHCRRCDLCVELMCHHCLLLDRCIGFRNQKLFIAFMLHVLIAAFFFAGTGLLAIILVSRLPFSDASDPL